jgi:tRNA-dihydrouridine synthase A
MMDRTDRHFRFFLRQISRHTLLYTEMVTTGAVLNGDVEYLLGFSPEEKPLALQLGGDNPEHLARAARLAAEMDYDEINLNVGCPSDRVQEGHFGACLMAQPERVAAAVAAMRAEVPLPITVKHRIGIDDLDRYEDMLHFVDVVAEAGADRFTVHARKAWLKGLSPKQNRDVPPLRYADVYRLKQERAHLKIEINGGIRQFDQISDHLRSVDAVMIGRAANDDPYLFARADAELFAAEESAPTRRQVVQRMLPYVETWRQRGLPLAKISRHLLGLFAGQPGSRRWRRHLSQHGHLPGAGPELLLDAAELLPAHVLDAPPENPEVSPTRAEK